MQRNDILCGEYILEAYRKVFKMEIGGKEMTQELAVQAWLTDFDSQYPQKVMRDELYKVESGKCLHMKAWIYLNKYTHPYKYTHIQTQILMIYNFNYDRMER